MNFPISRERLQNLSKEFEESQVNEFIKFIVDEIKTSILMKAYTDSPDNTPGLQSSSITLIPGQTLTKKIKLTLPLQVSYQTLARHNRLNQAWLPPPCQWNSYLPTILEKLQELFPYVTFQVDPLKTYLLIDWS
jgi:hypothetical protein